MKIRKEEASCEGQGIAKGARGEELIEILLDYRAKIITKQKYNLEDYLKSIKRVKE